MVLGLKGTKDTVIALAAKVQDLHEQIVNEMAVNRNLKRFHIDEEGGSGRRGVSTGVGFLVGHDETRRIGTTYDQAYSKLNVLFQTPPRKLSNRPRQSLNKIVQLVFDLKDLEAMNRSIDRLHPCLHR